MNGNAKGLCIDWVAGPSAQVELFSPTMSAAGGGQAFQMKYTPPFRATIRPPVEELNVGAGELDPIQLALTDLIKKAENNAADAALLADMQLLGEELLTFLIPRYVQSDLRAGNLFLEIGMDTALLSYPWELMHDGEDFLCLKHSLGRFVNSSSQLPTTLQPPSTLLGSALAKLSVLVISVPAPEPRQSAAGAALVYDKLQEAEAETTAIIECLAAVADVEPKVLIGKEATYHNVFSALKREQFQIIHYNGHAYFNDRKPYLSGLVLHDRDMTTGPLASTIGTKPPVLCFINACETAKSVQAASTGNRLDIYGLARGFLDTGAYLLGSRWKINDQTSAEFAKQFYTSLIQDGKSMGKATLEARKACKQAVPADVFGWASYVYYGDPRICFRRA
jgi:CHAT domain-containing protein